VGARRREPDSMTEEHRRFASEVKRLRTAYGWSQADLAERVPGLTAALVYRIESNGRKAGLDEALGIARAFRVSVEALTNPEGSLVDFVRVELVTTLREARRALLEARAAVGEASRKTVEAIEGLPIADPLNTTPYVALGDVPEAGQPLDEALTSAQFWLEQVRPLTAALDAVLDNPTSQPIRESHARIQPMSPKARAALLADLGILAAKVLPDDESDPVEGTGDHA